MPSGAQKPGSRRDRDRIERLRRRIRTLEERGRTPVGGRVATGWAGVDRALSKLVEDSGTGTAAPMGGMGLARGVLHEWFGLFEGMEFGARGVRRWAPPLSILAHLAWKALDATRDSNTGPVLWIGRRVWPYPHALVREAAAPQFPELLFEKAAQRGLPCMQLARSYGIKGDRSLLSRSFFVDPPDEASRSWAIDRALRCPSVSVVIADGSRLTMATSRRFQLAAEAARERAALALIVRPPWEETELSVAATRWRVRRIPSETALTRWEVGLVRCKGAQWERADPSTDTQASVTGEASGVEESEPRRSWVMEWNHAQSAVSELAHLVDRPGAATGSAPSSDGARRSG